MGRGGDPPLPGSNASAPDQKEESKSESSLFIDDMNAVVVVNDAICLDYVSQNQTLVCVKPKNACKTQAHKDKKLVLEEPSLAVCKSTSSFFYKHLLPLSIIN